MAIQVGLPERMCNCTRGWFIWALLPICQGELEHSKGYWFAQTTKAQENLDSDLRFNSGDLLPAED